MAIKSILLHMAPDPSRETRLKAGLDLAKRFDAHLHIVYMTKPIHLPAQIAGRGASAAFLAQAREIARGKASEVKEWLEGACNATGVSWDMEVAEGDHNDELARFGHYADLIIVSKDHGITFEDYVGLHKPDDLLMMATCPVLMLPKRDPHPPIGKRIMVAWKDSKEAARAVRDGLHFLAQAEKVFVFTSDEPHHRYQGSEKLTRYLERHGIASEPLSDVGEHNVGDTVLSYAEDHEVDLLIMGAYGRSRWREIIFGGVTHKMLTSANIPLLLSH